MASSSPPSPTPVRQGRCVGYLRVSTDLQAEHGHGLKVQERAIRTFAGSKGFRLVKLYRDEGVSGSNGLDTRSGLGEALRALQARHADSVVVYRLDRLARDLVLQEQLIAEIWRMGCMLYSTAEGENSVLDPTARESDPSRDLIRQVLGAVAQYERAMVRLRLRAGKERKAEAGGYIGGGVQLGKRVVARELVDDLEEQRALLRMLELHQAGASYREIVASLNAEGFQTKRGGQWLPATVRRIVLRQVDASD
jgi:DNA invertase Pin-like site-specific DNA recombinase